MVVLSVHNLSTVRHQKWQPSGSTGTRLTSRSASREWCLHVVIPVDTTVGKLLERYDREILPTHKGQSDWGLDAAKNAADHFLDLIVVYAGP